MSFDATSAATTDARSLVASVSTAIGAVQTLDETPPSFTELSVVDPTAGELGWKDGKDAPPAGREEV